MNRKNWNLSMITLGFLVATISMSSCGQQNNNKAGNEKVKTLIGAGSSFDNPLFSKMFYEYHNTTGLQINYQSVGSGAGISQLTHKTVDFGATDAPMNSEQEKEAGGTVLHIPITAGAVVLSYNLPEVKESLKMNPLIIADIFLGKISNWNDAQIAAINPGIQLPNLKIVVAHRSDGSGTTSIFTTYLSKVNEEWNGKVGKGTSINWPVGLGGKGNEGVSGLIKQTPGAIGYIELAYAIQNKMPYADVQNKAGNYIKPSIESVTTAANIEIPADAKISLTNTDAPEGYPISSFSWVIIYKEQSYNNNSAAKAKELLTLINWMINEGQQYSTAIDYAPLSDAAVKRATEILKSATYNGKGIL